MSAKDYYPTGPKMMPREPQKPPRRRKDRPGLGAALLAIVCVASVFGLLGLLYSLG
jgi:hypothetical protein